MNECVDLSLFYKSQINNRKSSDKLGRYYTPRLIAETLCLQLGKYNNCSILDLGCGSGNLITGSLKYWNDCTYHGCDIDNDALNQLKNLNLKNLNLHNIDIIHENLKINNFDVVISNPPYVYLSKDKVLDKLDNDTLLENEILKLNKIPAALIFLTKAIKALKHNGKIGIIVPNGILTNQKYQSIRDALVNSYKIDSVIQLEPYVFEKTETYAHILILNNTKPCKYHNISFSILKDNKIVNQEVKLNKDISKRLDFYNTSQAGYMSLGDVIQSISRGKHSSKFIKNNPDCNIFHTTDFDDINKKYISNKFYTDDPGSAKYAQKGDVIIARVGRDFFKKIKVVRKNYLKISDSIIVIRPIKNKTGFIYSYLKSKQGQMQLKANSQGTGAKYITHSQILNLPVIDNMDNINDF